MEGIERKDLDITLSELDNLQGEFLKETDIEKLSDKTTEEAYYFKCDNYFSNLNINDKLYKEGASALLKGGMNSFNFKMSYKPSKTSKGTKEYLIGTSTMKSKDGFPCRLIVSQNSIIDARCNDPRCSAHAVPILNGYLRTTPCIHITQLVIYTKKHLTENAVGDYTSANSVRIMTSLRGEDTEENPIIKIVPQLTISEKERFPVVSFRIGADRMYKVKNIGEVYQAIVSRKKMLFGQKTNLLLSENLIEEDSKQWVEFIRNVLNDEFQRSFKRLDNIAQSVDKDELYLYGNYIDMFYDALGDAEIDAVIYGRQSKIKADTKKPEVKIVIRQEKRNDEFVGIRITGNVPTLIEGQKYSYYLEAPLLCRLDSEYVEKLRPLSKISDKNRINEVVGRKHLGEFYNSTYPIISEVADIEEIEPEAFREYIPPAPKFITYIDYTGYQFICRANVLYGDKICDVMDIVDKTKTLAGYRSIREEKKVFDCIISYMPEYSVENNIFSTYEDEEAMYEFLFTGLAELTELSEIKVTNAFKNLMSAGKMKADVGISLESNLLQIDLNIANMDEDEFMAILRAYKEKKNFFRLKNGDFLNLQGNETVEMLSLIMDTMRIPIEEFVKGKMDIPVYRALYLDKMLEKTEGIYTERDHHFKKLVRDFKSIEDSEYDIPSSINATLRSYQKTGYRWLHTLAEYGFGGILADEMGLGKTLQTISLIEAYKEENPDKDFTTLIVCPSSLIYNWDSEITKFAPNLSHVVVSGNKNKRERIIMEAAKYDVVITSYVLLIRDIEQYAEKSFRFEIIDEAQAIKNHTTATAKAVKLIKSTTKIALTGTPIENKLSELWSIFDYLMQGYLYDYTNFKTLYETPIVSINDLTAKENLRKMVMPFILRRLKKDVLKDLPDKIEEVTYAYMDEQQDELYRARLSCLREELKGINPDAFNKKKIEILAEITRLRQICCEPSLAYENYDGQSAKLERLMDMVDEVVEGEHRALIFSQFTTMLDVIGKRLSERGIEYYKIVGETPKEKRISLVNSFNRNNVPIFLISLKAGGTGLNLTGADVVIHYDPWWNVAAQNQATDRAHRIGQKNVVTVYKLITKDTIEEKILELQNAKAALAEDILGGEDAASASFSKDELLEILK